MSSEKNQQIPRSFYELIMIDQEKRRDWERQNAEAQRNWERQNAEAQRAWEQQNAKSQREWEQQKESEQIKRNELDRKDRWLFTCWFVGIMLIPAISAAYRLLK